MRLELLENYAYGGYLNSQDNILDLDSFENGKYMLYLSTCIFITKN